MRNYFWIALISYLCGSLCAGVSVSLWIAEILPSEAVVLLLISIAWFICGERCCQHTSIKRADTPRILSYPNNKVLLQVRRIY